MRMKKSVEIDELIGQVVDTAYKLRTRLGLGLLEPVYELVLSQALGMISPGPKLYWGGVRY